MDIANLALMGTLAEHDDVLAGGELVTSVFSVLRLFNIRICGASFSVSIELNPFPFFEEVEERSVRCIFVIRCGGANCSVSIELVPFPFFEEVEGILFDCLIALLRFFKTWAESSVSAKSESKVILVNQK